VAKELRHQLRAELPLAVAAVEEEVVGLPDLALRLRKERGAPFRWQRVVAKDGEGVELVRRGKGGEADPLAARLQNGSVRRRSRRLAEVDRRVLEVARNERVGEAKRGPLEEDVERLETRP